MSRAPFRSRAAAWTFLALSPLAAAPAQAAELDRGDTAWVIVASALVLFMMIPGLALFYAGLVRAKNVLSVLMHCIALTALGSVLWLACGYSLAFETRGMEPGVAGLHAFVGTFDRAFLRGLTVDALHGSIPESLFFVFQATFAVITPGLIVGAFAERMRFSAMLAFSAAWMLLVYVPVAHALWAGPGGFFADLGVLDFAGGIVVHLTAGVAALVACIAVGPRLGYGRTAMLPHNLTMCFTGTGMLWVGWFGFNGGSALAADGHAAMAALVTHVSGATAATTWMAIEWWKRKPSVLGIATGAVAGLAAVTPASGSIGPIGGFAIGLAAGVVCYLAATSLKQRFGYDDSLDVFGVHGVGGLLGSLLVAVFTAPVFGGAGDPATYSVARQLGVQLLACGVVALYTGVVSWALLRAVDAAIGLRVDGESETRGLDLSLHDEAGYNA